jgi:hypothetical protein
MGEGRKYISYRLASEVIKAAASDLGEDYEKVKGRFMSLTVRSYDKLNRGIVKDGGRQALLTINQHTNTAVLPCDFKEETFIGFIDDCGLKYPLRLKSGIVDMSNIEDKGCQTGCGECTSCYPNTICNDIKTTPTVNKVLVNGVLRDELVYTSVLPNGEVYIETETPYYDTVDEEVKYRKKKEYAAKLETEKCGCVKKTPENDAVIKSTCYDYWCRCCTVCKDGPFDLGGYNVFPETNIIKFDSLVDFEKVYIEYRSGIPKSGNEYLIPDIAFDTIVEMVKELAERNRKNVPGQQKRMNRESVLIEVENMKQVMMRTSVAVLHEILNRTPRIDEYSGCYYNYHLQ